MTVAESAQGPLSDADWYRLVRSQIEFEASLVAQRISWFVAAQSFLFTAYAITMNAPRDPAVAKYAAQQHLVFILVPVVAIACCILIYAAILGAIFAQIRLRKFLAQRLTGARLELYPPVQGGRGTHLLGLATPLGVPLVFVVVWITLFFCGLS